MFEFAVSRHHTMEATVAVTTDEDETVYVSDDLIGEAAQELLRTEQFDSITVLPAWMAHEVTQRAHEIDPEVDASYDYDVYMDPSGEFANIFPLTHRSTR